ncbi:MAG: CRISPR-associated endoribonuclease Cas6 [Candidatus Promineifilaceae bacterium]
MKQTKQQQTTHSSAPDLHALIIRLIAARGCTLRATQGHLAHAAFLDMLHQADAAVAKTVHDMHGRKPFTISPLEGFGHGRKGTIQIKAGQEGWLRVTLLDPTLFHTFIGYFLQGNNRPRIQLSGAPFHISEVLGTNSSHPLAGAASLAHLQAEWASKALSRKDGDITLHFRTPTAFSLRNMPGRHMYLLPDPALVFGGLAGSWDRLSGDSTYEGTETAAAQNVAVARYHIKTHAYQYGNSVQIGFTGPVTFKILDQKNESLVRHLNRLADLAFYTGVGYKTTMGMGQVTRE